MITGQFLARYGAVEFARAEDTWAFLADPTYDSVKGIVQVATLSADYLDSTWEPRLPSFRTAAEPNVYQRLPDGIASLDGYPVV